jgi:RNA polymerase sigma-70 factor (family 1)
MMSLSSLTDLQLIDLLKSDNEDAFSEIYNRYAESLASFASSKLYTLEDAKDIVHDVFVKLWTERRSLTIDRNLKAYLFTLTRYRIIDQIRKNITREEYADIVQALALSYELSVEQRVYAKELQLCLEKSLTQLPPRVVEIFKLSREQHLSISQIAQKLQLSEQTVKNQLSTALKHLRGTLALMSAPALAVYLLI